MKPSVLFCCAVLLSACGYKGDLYLPKENDKNQFGVIQTGLQMSPTPSTQPIQKAPQ